MASIVAMLFMKIPPKPVFTASKFKEVPIPKTIHSVLTEKDVNGKELIVVGDIHGCLDELKEVIDITRKAYGENCLYLFVGDLVNKGPKSCEVVSYVRTLDSYSVRGNHEESCIRDWVRHQNGTLKQFNKKYKWMEDMSKDNMSYIMGLPYTISIPSMGVIIVHAGLSPWKHINKQVPEHMVSMRDIKGIDLLKPSETSKAVGVPWASLWPGPEHVYFGHDARRTLQEYPHATGLDTGCVYGNYLTAINVSRPNEDYITVKSKSVYEPT